jgi:hypothetical protein
MEEQEDSACLSLCVCTHYLKGRWGLLCMGVCMLCAGCLMCMQHSTHVQGPARCCCVCQPLVCLAAVWFVSVSSRGERHACLSLLTVTCCRRPRQADGSRRCIRR